MVGSPGQGPLSRISLTASHLDGTSARNPSEATTTWTYGHGGTAYVAEHIAELAFSRHLPLSASVLCVLCLQRISRFSALSTLITLAPVALVRP